MTGQQVADSFGRGFACGGVVCWAAGGLGLGKVGA